MAGNKRVIKAQVEHKTRQQLGRTLEQSGPLTVRGLARETKQPIGSVKYHLDVLARAGIVAPFGERRGAGEETAYTLTIARVPVGALNTLLGELTPQIAVRLVEILTREGPLSASELADRADLSLGQLERYMRALIAARWIKPTRAEEIADDIDRLRDCPEWLRQWMRLTPEGDDDEDEERRFL